MGDGYYVRVQHCERPGCDAYLGVNYPASQCVDCGPVTSVAALKFGTTP
jgi:hypothetical protein